MKGLTATYNRVHDPSEVSGPISCSLDRYTSRLTMPSRNAYGWADVDLTLDFYPTKQGMPYTLGESARLTNTGAPAHPQSLALQGRTRLWSSREEEFPRTSGKRASSQDKMDKAIASGRIVLKNGELVYAVFPAKHEYYCHSASHHPRRLTRMVVRDLLGPAGGEVRGTGRTRRTTCSALLVGILAPRPLTFRAIRWMNSPTRRR